MTSAFNSILCYLKALIVAALIISTWPAAGFEELDGASTGGVPGFSESGGLTLAAPTVSQGVRSSASYHHLPQDFFLESAPTPRPPALVRAFPDFLVVLASPSDLYLSKNKTGPPSA
jgi:hypothetical protein